MILLLGMNVQRGFEWSFAGRWAGGDGVVAGEKLPAVLVGVEDGEGERVEGEGYVFRFAGCELDTLPRGEAL